MRANSEPTGAVVLGCDRSWESQNAVDVATREASLRRSELVLLAVVETHPFGQDRLAWMARMEAEAKLEAHGALDRAIAMVKAADSRVPWRTVFVNELDSPELAGLVREAGLLVLGRPGAGGQVALSLGSTSAELARHFHCPILMVHDRGRATKRECGRQNAVFAAIGTSGRPSEVFSVAATEAAIRDMSLFVVQALPLNKAVDGASIDEGWRRCRADSMEARWPAEVPVWRVITRDDTVRALRGRVIPGDLLVIGTRCQGRLAGLVRGSISRRILDEAICDVMVVPPGLKPPVTAPSRQHRGFRQNSRRRVHGGSATRARTEPAPTGRYRKGSGQ